MRKYEDFIKSDLNEAEFFGVSKENSITVNEYLEEMHDVDYKFHRYAESEVESIKRKLDWVENVDFYDAQNKYADEGHLSFVYLNTKDGRQIAAYRYKNSFESAPFKVPVFAFFNKTFSQDLKRREELEKIKRELEEISNIGLDVYKKKLIPRQTVSDKFDVHYRPEAGLYIFDQDSDMLLSLLRPGRKCYDKPIVKDKEKQNVYRRILIKK